MMGLVFIIWNASRPTPEALGPSQHCQFLLPSWIEEEIVLNRCRNCDALDATGLMMCVDNTGRASVCLKSGESSDGCRYRIADHAEVARIDKEALALGSIC